MGWLGDGEGKAGKEGLWTCGEGDENLVGKEGLMARIAPL